MFKRPRKTCHSDARVNYERIHDDIMKRLTDDFERSKYLCDMFPLMQEIGQLNQVEARTRFFTLASAWMTEDELKTFTEKTGSGPGHSIREDFYFCPICQKSTDMSLDEVSSVYVCEECGCTKSYIGPSSDRYLPWDHQPAPAACPYRRSNHFNEYLDSFMARQTGTLPDEIFEKIYKELRKQRVTDYSTLTQKRLRSIMKDLRFNKYYESAPFILYQIKGEKPPQITPAIEQELKSNFDLIQDPFETVVQKIAPERKNFLSYSYTIFKMLQLMELDHLLEYFTLLKSREKLLVQDKIWKGICEIVGWRFIPSI